MINNERCYSFDELNDDLFRRFSEGSESLFELLRYCHSNEIETRACCAGHNEVKKPYILLIIPKEQQYIIENVINDLFNNNFINEKSGVSLHHSDRTIMVNFEFNKLDVKERDYFFQAIHYSLVDVLQNKKNNSGIYENLLGVYDRTEENDSISINKDGINLYGGYEGYFISDGVEDKEISEEEAKNTNKDVSTALVRFLKRNIKNEELTNFISNYDEMKL
jgi:hypothetical protein